MIGAKASILAFLGPATFVKGLPYLWYSGRVWTGGLFGGYAGVVLAKRLQRTTYSTGDIFVLGLPRYHQGDWGRQDAPPALTSGYASEGRTH